MTCFDKIEKVLKSIIETGYHILDILKQEEPESLKKLFADREQQLQQLNKLDIQHNVLPENEKERLRNLFTQFTLLEKRIKNALANLSAEYRRLLAKIDLHKKAKKSYHAVSETNKFLDTHVNG